MRYTLSIDLRGSRLGSIWRSVECEVEPPFNWSVDRLRIEASHHYGVPIGQVGEPEPVLTSHDEPQARTERAASEPVTPKGRLGTEHG